ncbi:hypothetical protein ACP70R_002709 [Stipagrostis hirtigluma subsp. patula]
MACTAKAAIILFLVALVGCRAVADRPGACKLSDIHVSATPTGKKVAGQPEFRVIFENHCSCPQASVRVSCPHGLRSIEPFDKSKLRMEAGWVCLVNDGLPIAKGSPVIFVYAWNSPQDFLPVLSAVPHC